MLRCSSVERRISSALNSGVTFKFTVVIFPMFFIFDTLQSNYVFIIMLCMIKVQKSYKFRIYPTAEQQRQLAIEYGHNRWVWNHCLDLRTRDLKRVELVLALLRFVSTPAMKREP